MENNEYFAPGWANLCLTSAKWTVQGQQLTQNVDQLLKSPAYQVAFVEVALSC